jgi:hypothetical protein
MFSEPIALLTYKRPELTKNIINIILSLKPRKFYIIQDGPKRDFSKNDKTLFNKNKKIILSLNNIKNVSFILFKKNLGLRTVAVEALKEIFLNEEKIIFLEDDTMPDKSFFYFCKLMLKKYNNNKKIFHISGTNQYLGSKDDLKIKSSYFFSKYPQFHGWATWKDRWERYYDVNIRLWPKLKNKFLNHILKDKQESRFFKYYLDKIYKNKFSTWDFQWSFALILNNFKTIVPNENLIKNLGYLYDPTGIGAKKFRKLEIKKLKFPLKHPQSIKFNESYDAWCRKNFYCREIFIIRFYKKFKEYNYNIPYFFYYCIKRLLKDKI